MSQRIRVDRLLVARGLFDSRARAQAAIAAGRVTADGRRVRLASEDVEPGACITAEPAHPYVSRGGVKLAAALDHFGFDARGRIALDVGASTGGFTQVLLARGAQRVYALDVGRDQLHASLRAHNAVVNLQATDIRALDKARLPQPPDAITVDTSFIALRLVLPAALALARGREGENPAHAPDRTRDATLSDGSAAHAEPPPVWLVALVKPQFEAGRAALKKGIVRDPEIHARVCAAAAASVRALGWRVCGCFPSPLAGGDGNREFLLGAVRD
ncbi:MAG: TlyA family RNA methyltransferase [Proteobacteria bacterium]|nr:TlyA family RNA methyltransferase [Pseudomonadota bacterium]